MSHGLQATRIALCGCGGIGRVHAGNLAARADLLFQSRTAASAEKYLAIEVSNWLGLPWSLRNAARYTSNCAAWCSATSSAMVDWII